MPMPMKPTPLKFCISCGDKLERHPLKNKGGELEALLHFSRRKYCSRACMGAGFRGRWRHDTLKHQGRWRARQIIQPTSCADCGKRGRLDIHHINENPLDNSLKNLVGLCRSCHLKRHKRDRFCEAPDCGRKHKGHGLCDMHLQRHRKLQRAS